MPIRTFVLTLSSTHPSPPPFGPSLWAPLRSCVSSKLSRTIQDPERAPDCAFSTKKGYPPHLICNSVQQTCQISTDPPSSKHQTPTRALRSCISPVGCWIGVLRLPIEASDVRRYSSVRTTYRLGFTVQPADPWELSKHCTQTKYRLPRTLAYTCDKHTTDGGRSTQTLITISLRDCSPLFFPLFFSTLFNFLV